MSEVIRNEIGDRKAAAIFVVEKTDGSIEVNTTGSREWTKPIGEAVIALFGGNDKPRKVRLPQRQAPPSRLDYSPRMVGWNDCLNEVEAALRAAGVEVEQ